MKFTVIGNFSNDNIYTKRGLVKRKGGSSLYIAAALQSLGQEAVQIKTDGRPLAVTIFEQENEAYIDPSKNERIAFKDIEQFLDVDCVIITPLLGEVSYETVRRIRQAAQGIVAVDMQGYLRHVNPKTKKVNRRIINLVHFRGIDMLKVNEEECNILFPNIPVRDIFERLLKNGNSFLVVTRGEKGSMVITQSTCHEFKVNPLRVSDTVGAGDTFFAVFLYNYLETHDIDLSGKRASAFVLAMLKKRI